MTEKPFLSSKPKVPRPESRWRRLGFGLALLVGFAALGFILRSPPNPNPVPPPKLKTFVPRDASAEVIAEFQRLEAAARDADATHWAAERLAETYEETWIQFWDRLRASEDRMGLLAALDFDAVELPLLKPADSIGHGIQHRGRAEATRGLKPAQWGELVRSFQAAGWAIDGLELRMPAFTAPTATQGARSRVTFELHAITPSPVRRAILRGEMAASWLRPNSPLELPRLDTLNVFQLEILTRAGPPPFVLVARETLRARPGMLNVDPLIVLDFDGDNRNDICLAGRNVLYRNTANGFRSQPLLASKSTVVNAAIAGDFNQDGRLDFLAATPSGLELFRGSSSGGFSPGPQIQPLPGLENPWVMTSGDIDRDGDLDVWLAQYKVPYQAGQMPRPFHDANDGFPSFLLLNDGQGHFADATQGSGLERKRFRRTYSASWIDIDRDGRLDLVNIADFAGADLFLNQSAPGEGVRFRDSTELLQERRSFGMAHAITDFDGNGWPDLFVIGMHSPVADRLESLQLNSALGIAFAPDRAAMTYGNRTWLNLGPGKFAAPEWASSLARTGWSWGASVEDFDHDGDQDIYVVNGHKSLSSARDYDAQFWTHDLTLATSTNHSAGLAVFYEAQAARYYGRGDSYGGHQRNSFFLQTAPGRFHEVAWLLGLALPDDCRNLVAADLDNDGRLDLVITAVDFNMRPATHSLLVLRNEMMAARSVTIDLPPGAGAEFAGPPVVLKQDDGLPRARWPITGGSYRSQGPQQAHFGLGGYKGPASAERNGRILPTREFPNPP